MDTSYDHHERMLYISLILMHERGIADNILTNLLRKLRRSSLHFRELSSKQKEEVLMEIDRIIESYKGSLSIIIIKVNVKKGLSIRKRISLENFIYVILRGGRVKRFYCPSDLDTKHYVLAERLKYKLEETEIHNTDDDITIQLADILVNWYRKRRKRIENMIYIKMHHC